MKNDAETKKMKITFALLALTTWVTIFAAPVSAVVPWHGHPGWHGGPGWHGDIRFFHEHDFVVWRGGHWFHGWHFSRLGWWWVVPGGWWYFYPAPVYPYPDPYIPPAVAVQPGPPLVQTQPQAQTWYYCDKPAGYYPYVPQCSSAWKAVPATPPTTATPGSIPPPLS